jgi:hypothetical protein
VFDIVDTAAVLTLIVLVCLTTTDRLADGGRFDLGDRAGGRDQDQTEEARAGLANRGRLLTVVLAIFIVAEGNNNKTGALDW